MIWSNRGHEYDEKYSKLSYIQEDFSVSIFGCGNIGAFYYLPLQYFHFVGNCYDNNKVGQIFLNKKIKSIDSYNEKELLVLCASLEHMDQMKKQLIQKGLEEHKNFWEYVEFFEDVLPVLALYEKNFLYAKMIQLSLTERCMLRCIKCAHACNYVPMNDKDLDDSEIRDSIDNYFKYVDFVQYFLLIGGEPLMSKGLQYAIEYIGQNYRDRIGRLQISTNGILIPNESLMNICKKYKVFFHISNYSLAISGMHDKLKKLIALLDENEIEYYLVPKELEWTDYGFDHVDRNHMKLPDIFDSCKTECHEIRRNKLYFCIMARSVAENTKRNIGLDDCLELVGINNEILTSKKEVFEYIMGYSEKGYLEMCNYCNGSERVKYPIAVAEQSIRE